MLDLIASLLCSIMKVPTRRLSTGLALLFAGCSAYSQSTLNYVDVHDFAGSDGEYSRSNVTFDPSGNAYGTCHAGGANGEGNVWEISSTGTYSDLHDFGGTITTASGSTGRDGENPVTGVTLDAAGDLFGTSYNGGPNDSGIVWEISSARVYTDLHDFGGTIITASGSSGPDGVYSDGGVALDAAGDLFGTAQNGGANSSGMVWEISNARIYTDIHDFGGTVITASDSNGPDGMHPLAGAAMDAAGDLFGTAARGGPNDSGMVWEITSARVYSDLHDFGGTVITASGSSGPDGMYPLAGVALDAAGDLFGATQNGGPNVSGMVWEISNTRVYTDLHDFGGTVITASGSSGPDGQSPNAGVTVDAAGDLFGTAVNGGSNGFGMVWERSSVGVYRDLHDFGGTITTSSGLSGPDGQNPDACIVLDAEGELLGTALNGGPNGFGMVWKLVTGPAISALTLNPSAIGGLGSTTATVTITSPAPAGGSVVFLRAGASGYLSMPASVTVPAGSTQATFTITGTAQRPATLNMGIYANLGSSYANAILTIQGDSLTTLTLNPSQITWRFGSSTATVSIASAAPPGGWIVNLTPSVGGYVNMPTTVTVPAGSTSTTFSIAADVVCSFTLNLGITASDVGSTAKATLTIFGDSLTSLTLNPTTIGWGGTSTATVTLAVAAPTGGWQVNTNAGASGYVSMPSSITVPAGATSTTFTVTAGSQRSGNMTLGIFANDRLSSQSALLTIQGEAVTGISLSPSTIGGNGVTTATVTLASPAPPSGWALMLFPGASGYVNMPSSLTVPAGSSTATFTISGAYGGNSPVNIGIFASDGNTTQEAILTLADVVTNRTYIDVHDFIGSDGANPAANLNFDLLGDVFGTNVGGGANGGGNVWEINSTGTFEDLHDFAGTITTANGSIGSDGANPYGGATFDSRGNMYGTTSVGEVGGMVWEITNEGEYRDLHDFGGTIINADGNSGPDGLEPWSDVTLDSQDNIYGTTVYGGPFQSLVNPLNQGYGTVWEITSDGVYKDLHDFGAMVMNANGSIVPDGQNSESRVTLDAEGDLLGTTMVGGVNDGGVLWEITSADAYLDLHDFGDASIFDGSWPLSGVTLDPLGNMFGTTYFGGGSIGSSGVLWEYSNSGQYNILHRFGYKIENANGMNGPDGSDPYFRSLTFDGAGNMFGTTNNGGALGYGMVWELTQGGVYSDLHDFGGTVVNADGTSGPDGQNPYAGVTLDSVGNIYGVATLGGPTGNGMVWELINVPNLTGLTLSPSTIGGLGSTTATITLSSLAPIGGTVVNLQAATSGYLNLPSTVTVPAGSNQVTFTITGTAQRSATLNIGITASLNSSVVGQTLTVQGDNLTGLQLNPISVSPGSGSIGTITINSPAPPGGWVVSLFVGAPSLVGIPPSVTVPEGATTVTFPLTTYIGESPSTVLVFAKDGASFFKAFLNIT